MPVIPGIRRGGAQVQGQPGRPYLKNKIKKKAKRTGVVVQVVEYLLAYMRPWVPSALQK
jgi:hypothetical protein